jgi:Pyruvate/2-oxoacid:ferredoxin oxidoreductase delta subunit
VTTKTLRKIVKIDEEKCNGCGACIISCAEGALKIIDGKARLVSETYCDGLGACLGKCPQDAITVEEREAEDFDEVAAGKHLKTAGVEAKASGAGTASRLTHWPVQLTLVPPAAPFLKGADLVLAADCVPFTYADFHRDFLGDNVALLVACPKLDDFPAHQDKLNDILEQSGIKSLTVLHMEVPCCAGLVHMARQAILNSGNVVPFRDITISIKGERKTG